MQCIFVDVGESSCVLLFLPCFCPFSRSIVMSQNMDMIVFFFPMPKSVRVVTEPTALVAQALLTLYCTCSIAKVWPDYTCHSYAMIACKAKKRTHESAKRIRDSCSAIGWTYSNCALPYRPIYCSFQIRLLYKCTSKDLPQPGRVRFASELEMSNIRALSSRKAVRQLFARSLTIYRTF